MRYGGVTTALSQSLDDLLTPATAMSSSLPIHIFSCLVTSYSPPRLVFCLSPHAPSSHLHSSALYAYLILASSPSVFHLSILAVALSLFLPRPFLAHQQSVPLSFSPSHCSLRFIQPSSASSLNATCIQLCYKSPVTLFPPKAWTIWCNTDNGIFRKMHMLVPVQCSMRLIPQI